jgi:hypothetical protein
MFHNSDLIKLREKSVLSARNVFGEKQDKKLNVVK